MGTTWLHMSCFSNNFPNQNCSVVFVNQIHIWHYFANLPFIQINHKHLDMMWNMHVWLESNVCVLVLADTASASIPLGIQIALYQLNAKYPNTSSCTSNLNSLTSSQNFVSWYFYVKDMRCFAHMLYMSTVLNYTHQLSLYASEPLHKQGQICCMRAGLCKIAFMTILMKKHIRRNNSMI